MRLQAKRIRELEDYIDAQGGGPGRGWFRIVTDPYESRRVVNAGKLAVVQGIEVSEPLGCRVYNGRPFCDEAKIDRELDAVHRLGVRDMELTNKYETPSRALPATRAIKSDGVAHYGLYPDWVEDLRHLAGNGIVRDLARGSEAYLQMWERTDGVPREHCRSSRVRLTRRGLGRHRLGLRPTQLPRRAGQPARRRGRVFRYCVSGRGNRRARVAAVFTRGERVGLLAGNARRHRTVGAGRLRIGRGTAVRRLRGRARRLGRRLYVRRARGGVRFVYGVRRGRVRYVAVASRSVGPSGRRLRASLRLAGIR